MEDASLGGDQNREQEPLELEIVIVDIDATEEELDRMSRDLLAELRKTDVESASLVSLGEAPDGSKGDPITIGTLVVTALPSVLPVVVDLVKSWTSHGQGRTVKFKGKGIEFEGSPQELEKILSVLEKGKRGK